MHSDPIDHHSRRILLALHSDLGASHSDHSAREFSYRLQVNEAMARVALERLAQEGLAAEDTMEKQNPEQGASLVMLPTVTVHTGRYFITDKGVRAAARITPEERASLSSEAPTSQGPSDPTAATWEPLVIDRQNEETKAVVASLQELEQRVSEENGYADTFPAERLEVLSRLGGAVRIFQDSPVLTYSAFQAFVQWPLEELLRRFSQDGRVRRVALGVLAAVGVWAQQFTNELISKWVGALLKGG